MEQGTAEKILDSLKSGYALPALSLVALKLVESAADDHCSASRLAGLIEKDPSLSVRLLKLANSAFFGGSHPVTTLEQAVVKVGFHRLRIMALSLSLRDTFPMGKIGSMDYERFWRTSLYRALLAKSLARHLKICSPEEAFVSGLILEIGLLVFFDLLMKGRDEVFQVDPERLEECLAWERRKYGLDHRQVGYTALRYWKFPEDILNCQAFSGKAAGNEKSPPMARICELARRSSNILFLGSKDFNALYTEAKDLFGTIPETMNDILISTFQEVQEIADNLRLELNREKDLMSIMEKANQALSLISERMPDPSLPSFDSLSGNGEVVTHTLQAVAHEIRNPLLALGGFAKRLSANLDPSSSEGKYAQVILQEALRLEKALEKMTVR